MRATEKEWSGGGQGKGLRDAGGRSTQQACVTFPTPSCGECC